MVGPEMIHITWTTLKFFLIDLLIVLRTRESLLSTITWCYRREREARGIYLPVRHAVVVEV